MKLTRTNKKGFTIVELVIVIAVIAILAAVLIPNLSRLVDKANESKALQEAESAMKVDLINANGDYNNLTDAKVVKLGTKSYIIDTLTKEKVAGNGSFTDATNYDYYLVAENGADVATATTTASGGEYYKVSKNDDSLVVKGSYNATAKTYTVDGYTFDTTTGKWSH